jgi:hypothetical protein
MRQRHLIVFILALGTLAGGCAWSVPQPVLVREPRPERIALRIGVYYSPEFRSFTYRHHMTDTAWKLGEPSVRLFGGALALLFTDVVESVRPDSNQGFRPDVAGVIEPTIVSAGYIFPTMEAARRDGQACFSLHVTYHFTLYSPQGEPVTAWDVSGNDCVPVAKPLKAHTTLKESFEQVMREDAFTFVSGFRDIPNVRRWLAEQGIN